jgi:hypothetical protein
MYASHSSGIPIRERLSWERYIPFFQQRSELHP